ncbi:amino acid adenylation domain-containing protein [Methylomonas sp. SURF-2]|uniref:Amino acid adenylation domain-containing protein n=1 Tax=Methylomonas subterranea TaxID=2952225 RepID=A0ABT1TIE3_9GAMM|nr:amino acid adenylation domain-containing protein [Methylomonas sp. SURF-2]MCQ8105210.1 amino acid adenylation domain-containing protein [Methylomonas sp. SURF-2]
MTQAAMARAEGIPTSVLADNQQAIWYDQIARADSPVYNIGGRLAIYGEVDHALLRKALRQLVAENAALRLSIGQCGDGPRQTVRGYLAVELPLLDFSRAERPEAAAEDWLKEQFKQAISFEEHGIYWQFALLKISDSHYALLTKYHHLIADGWSTKIVIHRLAELYNALLTGMEAPAAETNSYLDFVADEARYLNSRAFQDDARFWQAALPSLPEALIRRKYPGNGRAGAARAHIHRASLSRAFYDSLRQWAGQHRAGIYHVLLGALAGYFARVQQQDCITVGLPALNRSGARYKNVVGMFASLSPLPIQIDSELSLTALLRHTARTVRQVHKHQRYPLSALHQRLQCLKNQREGLFDLVLSFEKQDYTVRFGDAEVSARQLCSAYALYPLAVTVCEFNPTDDVDLIFEGAETCFTPVELELLAGRLQWVLQQFIDSPEMLVRDVDLVPAAEKQLIFQRFNAAESAPGFNGVIRQFSAWVERTPEAIALSQHGRCLTYRMLDRLADRLAGQLQRRHIGAGDIVAVCMPRCVESMLSLLAIFKLRVVYLPVDIDSPGERIQEILRQSGAAALLTIGSEKQLFPMHRVCLCVDRLEGEAGTGKIAWPEPRADDPAYLIYTSGSSGQPKAAQIHHGALSLRLAWLQQAFKIQNHERVGQSMQTHFDPSLIEIGLAFTQGAQLVLPPKQHLTAAEFADFVLTENINALALVPGSLNQLLQGLPASGPVPLRVACCGGETLPAASAKAFIARTGAQLFNVYGPTETAILASAWQCGVDDGDVLPIGRPLSDSRILIVDAQLKLLPLAVEGEIVIGGACVAKGYLGREDLSRRVFVPDPYGERPGATLYRSGDRGYIGTDAELYFAGRLDRQLKIGGYRIEPAEIEQALLRHPAVARAAVAPQQAGRQKYLVAYVQAVTEQPDLLRAELADFLRGRLPDYMQPRAISVLDQLPLTANGKIAYERLPRPELPIQTAAPRGPDSALESSLLDVWRRILKKPNLAVEDSFFAQDTDSLTAIDLIAAIEKATGVRQSIAFLMAYPTVAEQAAQLTNTVGPQFFVADGAFESERHGANDLLRKHEAGEMGRTLGLEPNSPDSRLCFYLAASGHGDSMRFQALADSLSAHCCLRVLYPPGNAPEAVGMEWIARQYAELIRQQAPQGFYLGGFSIGGVTALETARLLELQGLPPIKLILLDTVYPRWPLRSAWVFRLLQASSGLWGLNEISVNGRKLRAMLTDPGIIQQLAALSRHQIKPYSGTTLLIMSKRMSCFRYWWFAGWRGLFGGRLSVDYVPGLHGAMFNRRYLPILARVILRGLQVV